ncbi:MAG: PAS domain S-box protein [Pseudomonadota bacterium]
MNGEQATPERRGQEDRSLLRRYHRLLLVITLPLFIVVLVLASSQYRSQRQQILSDLARASASHVITLEAIAKSARDHVLRMQAWSGGYLLNPASTPSSLRQHLTPFMEGGVLAGYTLDGIPPAQRPFVGQLLWLGENPAQAGQALRLLDQALEFFSLVRLTHDIDASFQWSYFLPASQEFANIYPWSPTRDLLRNMGHDGLRPGLESLYGHEFFQAGTPGRNPDRSAYWTEPYVDPAGSGAMVSHCAPVYQADRFLGVVGTDIRLATLAKALEQLPISVGRLLIVDDRNMLLADSRGTRADAVLPASSALPEGLAAADLAEVHLAAGGPVEKGRHVLVAGTTRHAPWTLIHLIPDREITALLLPRFVPYGIILALLAGTFLLALYLLRREFINPALELVHYIQRVSRDPTAAEPVLPRLWQTWTNVVSRTFAANREASRKLKENEAFKTAIVDNALLAVITMDAEGRVVEFNPAAEALFGHPRQTALGRDMADLIIPERNRAAHRAGLARYLSTRHSLMLGKRLELGAMTASGEEIPVELSVSANRVGEAHYFTAFVMDLRDKKRAEEELARQRDALRQSEKLSAMGALLAGVAHELNNPLAILMGRAALLEAKSSDPAIRSDALKIHAAAERCGRIVQTFLGMARQRPSARRPASFNELAAGALDLLSYSLRSSGIQVRTRLMADPPRLDMAADQIGQAVLNLLVNAQQALADQPEPRIIEVETGVDHGRAMLRIADNGPGIAPDLRERIFDPFFTTKAEGSGTGVGLSVSRAVMREQGGDLELESDAPACAFCLWLPLVEVAPAPPGADTPALPSPVPQAGHALIVDDEAEIASLLGDILRSAGFTTTQVTSGRDALAWLAGGQACDLILSDMRMPDTDGPALWRAVGQHHPHLAGRMAFITGDTMSPTAAPFLRETGAPWLEKPFTPEDVLDLIARLVPDPG